MKLALVVNSTSYHEKGQVTVLAAGTKIETRHPAFDKTWKTDALVRSFDSKADTYAQTLRKERGEFDGTDGRKSPVHKNNARILVEGHWVSFADL